MADDLKVELGGGNDGAGNGNGGANDEGNNEKTYTEAEFKSEVDRRVNEAIKTAQGKWQKDYETKLKAEKDEATRLAKLSADERAKAEFDKERKAFETERSKYQRDKLVFECSKLLAAENLSVDFAELLTGADADTTKTNIEKFKTAFNSAVEASVTERLKGNPPKGGGDKNPPDTDPFLSGFGK